MKKYFLFLTLVAVSSAFSAADEQQGNGQDQIPPHILLVGMRNPEVIHQYRQGRMRERERLALLLQYFLQDRMALHGNMNDDPGNAQIIADLSRSLAEIEIDIRRLNVQNNPSAVQNNIQNNGPDNGSGQ